MICICATSSTIAVFLTGVSESQFTGNDLLRSAVLQKLAVIGEAAARLSQPLKHRHSHVEWRDIVAFRNIVIHAYFSVQWPIVWVAATQDVPALRQQVRRILEAETA